MVVTFFTKKATPMHDFHIVMYVLIFPSSNTISNYQKGCFPGKISVIHHLKWGFPKFIFFRKQKRGKLQTMFISNAEGKSNSCIISLLSCPHWTCLWSAQESRRPLKFLVFFLIFFYIISGISLTFFIYLPSAIRGEIDFISNVFHRDKNEEEKSINLTYIFDCILHMDPWYYYSWLYFHRNY